MMNDYDQFPLLMWTITTAISTLTLVGVALPLAAACKPARTETDYV